MGKIRVKMLGDETKEKPHYAKATRGKEKHEEKKSASRRSTKAPGLKGSEAEGRDRLLDKGGSERVVTVGPSIEELEKETQAKPEQPKKAEETKEKKAKFKKAAKKQQSGKYQANANLVKKNTLYPIDKAIETLKKFAKAKFDETVELHINVKEKGISGQMSLPHGTGKQIRIKLADDAIIDQVSKGKIDFDILIAEPAIMPKLAKVARILGPKGLMPNPKAGTITTEPQKLIEKLSKGQVNFKTETEAPIIHMSVGKLSFNEKQLTENITTALSAIGQTKINNVTLKSTMSPAIKLQTSS